MKIRLSLLLALAASIGCSRSSSDTAGGKHPSFPNAPVIVISIDTLRADHLPAYGYKGVATPHIDALRRDSILFERAYAHVPLTLPSHVSLLTGLLPPKHGVRSNIGFTLDAAKHTTLPALLKQRGYATAAAVSAYVLRGSTGLRAVFDEYDDDVTIRGGESFGAQQRSGAISAASAAAWIDRRREQPFFYMLHLFEPHTPYAPPEPHRSRYPLAYDGEIAATDDIVGAFVAQLKKSGVYDKAIIVLLSDHGEGLGDHGEEEHGIFLYQEAIRVPLMVKLPGSARANTGVASLVGLVDVFPTIARLTGIEAPAGLDGVSLLGDIPAARRIYAETAYPRIHLGWSDLRSLTDPQFQYIEAPRPELYDLRSDPQQKTNVLAEQRRMYAALRKELDAVPRGEQTAGNIDPEEAKRLAALGYLTGASAAGDGPLPDPKDRIGELQAVQRASSLVREHKYDEAIATLRGVLETNPRFADAWTLLGRTYQDAGRIDEAIATYRRAMELSPQSAGDTGLTVAGLYLSRNELDHAEAHARLGEKTNPPMAHLMLGRVALARRQHEAALQHAQQTASSQAYRVQGLVLAAQVYARGGRAQQAMQLLEQADREVAQQRLGPVPLLEYTRGDVLARMNRVAEAEAAFRREIELFPADREAYASLAVVAWLSGRPAVARNVMQQLVRANPSPDSRRFAAKTLRELGDDNTARTFER